MFVSNLKNTGKLIKAVSKKTPLISNQNKIFFQSQQSVFMFSNQQHDLR